MDMKNVEFYNSPEGEVFIKEMNKPVRVFTIEDREITKRMLDIIVRRYPDAFKRLSEIYSRYDRNRTNYEFKMVHRFIRCNFGEYDQYHCDIDECGMLRFEEVKCPLRGECRHEGVICKPVMDTALTDREKEVLAMIAGGRQAQQIADELGISFTTVNRHRENIKAKLNLKTVGDLVRYYMQFFKK